MTGRESNLWSAPTGSVLIMTGDLDYL